MHKYTGLEYIPISTDLRGIFFSYAHAISQNTASELEAC